MRKPSTRDGYSASVTQECERLLVTLLGGLGPLQDSVFLVGGLTPRYIVPQQDDVPRHAGTGDVDIVIDQSVLAQTDAYATLEENLTRLGFECAKDDHGADMLWRWQRKVGKSTLVLELLTDASELLGGKVQPLPAEGRISALNIPHSSMVFDLNESRTIRAEKLDGGGITTQTVRHADVVSFTCLKAFAFHQRSENKDAHDLLYCLDNHPDGIDAIAARFRVACDHERHGPAVREALALLQAHFCTDRDEGHLKDGPVAATKFEDERLGRDRRILRQRQASDVVERLIKAIG